MTIRTGLAELAIAGATAVVAAMGTDAWRGIRDRVARMFRKASANRREATAETAPDSFTELAIPERDYTTQLRQQNTAEDSGIVVAAMLGNVHWHQERPG
jgi:hypothetical protein